MTSSRRKFIQYAGKAAIIFSTGMLFNKCRSIIRDDFQIKAELINSKLKLSDDEYSILHYASLAASSHNTQPWKVKKISNGGFIIGIDPMRLLSIVDPEKREAFLSLGAFLENLYIAAGRFGYFIEKKIIANSFIEEDIVEIKFLNDKLKQFPLEYIEKRRTIRNDFSSAAIKNEDIKFLFQEKPDSLFYFSPGSKESKILNDYTLESNIYQANRKDAQGELSNWIRWSNSDAKKNRDGLTPASMNITGFTGWYVRNFYDKSSVLEKNFIEKGIEKVKEQVNRHGGWIVITAKKTDIEDLLFSGGLFQKISFRALTKKIGIHPMTQILEENKWKEKINSGIGIKDSIQFILRIGYVDYYPEPVSLRRPVEYFTTII